MLRPLIFAVLFVGYSSPRFQAPDRTDSDLGPAVFAPGIVSTPRAYEYGTALSTDGTELFYGVNVGGRAEIRSRRWKDGGWGPAEVVAGDPEHTYGDPFLSADGRRLYFLSDRPGPGRSEGATNTDLWFIERGDGSWGEPVSLGAPINTSADEYYISFDAEGRIYFASNRDAGEDRRDFDIFVAEPSGDGFGEPEPLPGEINTAAYEADAFVAPDGSYIIFCSMRPEGLGEGDLYISRRRSDGSWGAGVHLGPQINTPGHELCPFVSSDGRFFYTSNKDLFWVDADCLEEFGAE